MGNRRMSMLGLIVAVAAVFATLPVLLAQTPDLSGIWVGTRDGAVFPREAPEMTPPTQETFDYRRNLRGGVRAELDPETLCEPAGLTWLLLNTEGGNSYLEIIQSPGRVTSLGVEQEHLSVRRPRQCHGESPQRRRQNDVGDREAGTTASQGSRTLLASEGGSRDPGWPWVSEV